MHRSMTPYQDHTGRAQKVSSESRLYGRVFRDNPYHHPSLLPSSRPRCFLLFSSHSSKPTRAIVGALRCCRSRKKKWKSVFRQQRTRARETRGVSASTRRRHVLFEKGGSPCRLSQLTCSVFLFYFRRFLFCARRATPHVPPPPPPCPSAVLDLRPSLSPLSRGRECPWSPYGARTLFWSRHTASQDALDCRLSPGITRRSF